jgi:hypothetical protein
LPNFLGGDTPTSKHGTPGWGLGMKLILVKIRAFRSSKKDAGKDLANEGRIFYVE